ncbi:hypothetical protein BDF19DRAFT_426052 [Syncephalis fuscata]|nr:hypothetical protein BDF19DRAFT_426052 [Syncephalis fuscata]
MSQVATESKVALTTSVDTIVNVETLVQLLVNAHIILLQRFNELELENDADDNIVLLRAEQRYLHWLAYLQKRRPDAIPVPPIDVAMLWCTHMLSPLRYMEDMIRLFGDHMLAYNIPLKQLTEKDADGKFHVDSRSQLEWEQLTGLSYTPNLTSKSPFSMTCPFCSSIIAVKCETYHSMRIHATPFDCPLCNVPLSPDTLSAKLFEDAFNAFGRNQSLLLRGTWLDHTTGLPDIKAAKLDIQYLRSAVPKLCETKKSEPLTWKMIDERINQARQTKERTHLVRIRQPTLRLIPSAYRNSCTPCSLDLINAVRRSRRFTRRIVNCLHWQQPQVLAKGVDRYGKFIALMAAEKKAFLVPTLGKYYK